MLEISIRMASFSMRGEDPEASMTQRLQAFLERLMLCDSCKVVVIEPGPSQSFFAKLKSQRSNEVQGRACIRTKAYDVAGVRRDLWFVENHIEHTNTFS